MSKLTGVKLRAPHPEDAVLLQYFDGELPKRQARVVQEHLEACWQCRAQVEELQATASECIRYRQQVMGECSPPPPQAWGQLDFASVDAEIAAESFRARWSRWLSPRQNAPLRWALSGALALLMGAAIVRQLRETPKVEAAALLRKAIAVSQTRPAGVRRVRITTATQQVTRVIGGSLNPSKFVAPAAEAGIARLFVAAHYDWNDPLSAKSFAAWRDSLPEKADDVAAQDPSIYSIKTTTGDGELLSATLRLRKTDFEPLEGRFEFRNRQWVEMTELVDQQTLPASTIAGATGGAPRQPGVPPDTFSSYSSPSEAAQPAEADEELQVVAALHQVGADLGDPVEISREGRQVTVSGTGISPRRQQELHQVLDPLPNVAVRFSAPTFPASNTPAQSETANARNAGGPEKTQNTARLEQRLGGRPQFERVSGQLLDWTDAAMTRAYALRRLAQQFTPAAERKMRPEDRRTLHALGGEHLAALAKDLDKIQNTLQPILGGSATMVTGTGTDWRAASEELLSSAHRMDTLLAGVLGVASANATAGDDPAQLLAAMAQLHANVELCQRLLAQ